MVTEASAVEAQIAEFAGAINQEHVTVDVLKERCRFFSAAAVEDQEDEIVKFDQRVEDVYRDCIGQNEAGISTLQVSWFCMPLHSWRSDPCPQMLTNIENKVEELFEAMLKMPPDQLSHAEKVRLADPAAQRVFADPWELHRPRTRSDDSACERKSYRSKSRSKTSG